MLEPMGHHNRVAELIRKSEEGIISRANMVDFAKIVGITLGIALLVCLMVVEL